MGGTERDEFNRSRDNLMNSQAAEIEALKLQVEEKGRALKQCEDENAKFMRMFAEAKLAFEEIEVVSRLNFDGDQAPMGCVMTLADHGIKLLTLKDAVKREHEHRFSVVDGALKCDCGFVNHNCEKDCDCR